MFIENNMFSDHYIATLRSLLIRSLSEGVREDCVEIMVGQGKQTLSVTWEAGYTAFAMIIPSKQHPEDTTVLVAIELHGSSFFMKGLPGGYMEFYYFMSKFPLAYRFNEHTCRKLCQLTSAMLLQDTNAITDGF